MESLLNTLRVTIRTHKGIEDGQDVAAVIHHARKNIAKLRVAFCLAVPFGQDDCGHFDVLPQLVRGMAAQEQAIEKGGLTLREVEIVHDFGGNELWHRGHRENAVYRKAAPRQVGLPFFLPRSGNPPFPRFTGLALRAQAMQRHGCQTILTGLGC